MAKILGTGLLFLSTLVASAVSTVTMSQAANPTPIGTQVLSEIHNENRLEIEAGRLAESRGQSAKVRDLGKRLVRDHQYVDRLVTDFAHEKNILLLKPSQPSETQAVLKALNQVSADKFDAEFLNSLERRHTEMIQSLRGLKDRVETAEIRNMISEIIPVLKQHEQLAQNLVTT